MMLMFVVVEVILLDRILFFCEQIEQGLASKKSTSRGRPVGRVQDPVLPANLSRLEYDNRTLDFC